MTLKPVTASESGPRLLCFCGWQFAVSCHFSKSDSDSSFLTASIFFSASNLSAKIYRENQVTELIKSVTLVGNELYIYQ